MPANISTKSLPDIEKNGTAGFTRDRTRQQRLARAGRPEEQHALRDRCADRREAFRFREEVLDLAQLLDGFVEPRDVGERHRRAALVGGDRA